MNMNTQNLDLIILNTELLSTVCGGSNTPADGGGGGDPRLPPYGPGWDDQPGKGSGGGIPGTNLPGQKPDGDFQPGPPPQIQPKGDAPGLSFKKLPTLPNLFPGFRLW